MNKQAPLFFLLLLFLSSALFANQGKIRVALFTAQGAHPRGNLIKALESADDITLTTLDGEELREGELNNIDLLIVPGGSAKVESMTMQPQGRAEVKKFVKNGGLYIGICAGAYLLTSAKPTDLALLPISTVDKAHWSRGKGSLPIELTPKGQEIFGTKEKLIHVLYHNGPVVDPSHIPSEANFTPLGYFRSELVAQGGKPGLMVGKPAMFLGRFGKGWVLGISPHPEASSDQVFMEINAIRWLYKHRVH